jgi:hypothetical protein
MTGAKRYYKAGADAAALDANNSVEYGTAITTSAWTELTSNGLEITPAATDKVVRVVEVDAADKPIGFGDAILNIG